MPRELIVSVQKQYQEDDAHVLVRRWLAGLLASMGPERIRSDGVTFSAHNFLSSVIAEENAAAIAHHNRTAEQPVVRLDYGVRTETLYGALWSLVRRGVLHPLARYTAAEQSTFGGHDFRLTDYGVRWALALPDVNVVPAEHDRFLSHLTRHAHRFGPIYTSRAAEAVDCYQFLAYIACCAMCGAASEALFLALASAKLGSEDKATDMYRRKTGARDVVNLLTRGQNNEIGHQLEAASELLRYWRNDASHAFSSRFDEDLAFMSLLLLLRLTHFAGARWDELVQPTVAA